MDYYSAKGKRRRAEQQLLSASNQTTFESSRDMKSLEVSTTINTLLTTTSYDDSDHELGAEIYRTSFTAKRLRDERQQATVSSTQTTTTRRKSSRSKDTKSKLSLDSTSPSTDDEKNTKKVIGSKRKVAALSLADGNDVCKEVTDNILKRVFRNGRYRRLCSSNGCTSLAQKGGVCIRHGAVVKKTKYECSAEGCSNHAQKGGVCKRHGAVVKRTMCTSEG